MAKGCVQSLINCRYLAIGGVQSLINCRYLAIGCVQSLINCRYLAIVVVQIASYLRLEFKELLRDKFRFTSG